MKKFIFATLFLFLFLFLFLVSGIASADNYSPYNQTYTYNQTYSSGNWYSSPLGQGVAQAGVLLVGGVVNAMSRPDPVVVQNQQPQYVNGNVQYPQQQQGYPQQGYGYPQQAYNYGYQPAAPNPYNQYPR